MVMKRGSAVECSTSGIVPASGSPKTDAASSNETPCFLRLSAAFCESHSNFTRRAYSEPASCRDPSDRPNTQFSGEGRGLEPARTSSAATGCYASPSLRLRSFRPPPLGQPPLSAPPDLLFRNDKELRCARPLAG